MPISKLRPAFTFTEDRLRELQAVVPEAFADGKINWDTLREALGEALEDEATEHFGFGWPGKREARGLASLPSKGTLIPQPGQGADEENTHNLFIEGDNLEVLKLLQKSYAGRVKMIYIDPPYNTGEDFIYSDNFSEPLESYLKKLNQIDEKGNLLTTNTKIGLRYHTNWLNMIYPRLRLAKTLLKNDGIIFCSIDDNEVSHLKIVMDEVFGEENFVAYLIWNLGTGTTAGHFTRSHEYIVAYARQKANLEFFASVDVSPIKHGALKKISKDNPASEITFPAGVEFEGSDAIFEGELGESEKEFINGKMVFEKGKLKYPVTIKAGWAMRNQTLSWLAGKETFDTKGQKVVRFFFNQQGILWYEKERATQHPKTVLSDMGSTRNGSADLEDLFGSKVLDFPKPVELIRFLVELTCKKNELILDFFAGSCTAAQAVLEQNRKDGGQRKFICVQIPAAVDTNTITGKTAYGMGLKVISDIGRERIKRVINRLKREKNGGRKLLSSEDLGFNSFLLDHSNFSDWEPYTGKDTAQLELRLGQAETPLVEGWQPKDLVAEILLLQGFPLVSQVRSLPEFKANEIKQVTSEFVGHHLYICLDKKVKAETVAKINLRPDDILVCLDSALSDEAKVKLADQCNLKVI